MRGHTEEHDSSHQLDAILLDHARIQTLLRVIVVCLTFSVCSWWSCVGPEPVLCLICRMEQKSLRCVLDWKRFNGKNSKVNYFMMKFVVLSEDRIQIAV